jgi:hypothetical protein
VPYEIKEDFIMPRYESIQDHDLLQERTSRLIQFTCFLLIALFALTFYWALFGGAAETQAIRETAFAENDCRIAKTGAHCFINGREAVIITAKGAR